MATTYKVLAQSAPLATTSTDVYTVPVATSSVVSTLVACNRSAAGVSYRVSVRPAGVALANQHYIAYDVTVAANDSTTLTLGLTLAATDVITVYAGTADLSFSVFGSEITE
jgi:hypothetical protein